MAHTSRTNVKRIPAQPPRSLFQKLMQYLYAGNPFYLLSVCFVFHGTAAWFQSEAALHNPWPLMGLISAYIVALAVTAFVIVRFGNVWDDARSIFLIVLILFVEMSLCFDDVLSIYPEIGKPLLLLGLLLAMGVSEGLLLGLRIRVPLLFRLPYHAMLALLFLYPLCLVPDYAFLSIESLPLSWRTFLFSPAAALLVLTLVPAVRRGADYVAKNGTPWAWPWFPWTALGTLIVGLCVRSFTITLSFDPVLSVSYDEAMTLPTTFGGYFLVPILLAIGILLLETGIVTRNATVTWLALAVPFSCIWLSIPAASPSTPYAEFLALFTHEAGSPIWLTAIGSAGYLAYALFRRVRAAEYLLVPALLLLSVVDSQTIGPATVVQPHAAPLVAVAVLQLVWGVWKADSRRTLLGILCGIAAVYAVTAVSWPDDVRELLAANLIVASTVIVGLAYTDTFSRLLRPAGAVFLVSLGIYMLWRPVPEWGWSLPTYIVTLIALAFLYAWWYSDVVYCLSGAAIAFAACCTLGLHAYTALKQLPEWKGIDSFLLAALCLIIGTVISAFKGGMARKLFARVSRS